MGQTPDQPATGRLPSMAAVKGLTAPRLQQVPPLHFIRQWPLCGSAQYLRFVQLLGRAHGAAPPSPAPSASLNSVPASQRLNDRGTLWRQRYTHLPVHDLTNLRLPLAIKRYRRYPDRPSLSPLRRQVP